MPNFKFQFQVLQGSDWEIVRPGNFIGAGHGFFWPAIYWGPDQFTSDSQHAVDIYEQPRAWKHNEFNRVPKVVRFIYDGYIHEFTQEGDPPEPGNGDPRLERTITVGSWTTNASGMTTPVLCQDPGFTFPNPVRVYQRLPGETTPASFTPPFTPGPLGPIMGFPVPPCADNNDPNCAISAQAPDYTTPITMYYQFVAFPAGHFVRFFEGTIADLEGMFGVAYTEAEECDCYYRSITVVTRYFEGTVMIWQSTVTYYQPYNSGITLPANQPPDPGHDAGPHCLRGGEEPDPDFPVPGDFMPTGNAVFVNGQWVPA